MIEFLTDHSVLSYLGIIFVLILTGGGLPIPEEVPIVAAGVVSSSGHLNPALAFASCLFGALMGDILIYSIGRFLGHNFFSRHPWFAHLLHEDREEQMERYIKKHGLKVLFLARFMVGVRAPIYLATGIIRVPWKRFLIVDAFCATMVVSVVFWLSFTFGEEIGSIARNYQWALTIAVAGVVSLAAIVFFIRHRRKPKDPDCKEDESSSEESSPQADIGHEDPNTGGDQISRMNSNRTVA